MSQHSHENPELYARIATATAREQRVAIQEHLRGTVMDADLVLEADKESGAYHDWKRRTGRTDAAGLAHEMQEWGADE